MIGHIKVRAATLVDCMQWYWCCGASGAMIASWGPRQPPHPPVCHTCRTSLFSAGETSQACWPGPTSSCNIDLVLVGYSPTFMLPVGVQRIGQDYLLSGGGHCAVAVWCPDAVCLLLCSTLLRTIYFLVLVTMLCGVLTFLKVVCYKLMLRLCCAGHWPGPRQPPYPPVCHTRRPALPQ